MLAQRRSCFSGQASRQTSDSEYRAHFPVVGEMRDVAQRNHASEGPFSWTRDGLRPEQERRNFRAST